MPTVRANLASGGSIDRATLVVAAWCHYSDREASKSGKALDIEDPMREALHRAARDTNDDPLSCVRLREVFGDLAASERFTARYAELVREL